ncbi:hypothetical protein KSP39_PZI006263 [Platanthera zijinensis]|uniref:Uncharacterized protein n=1 Tax=Platanthera zijinensis TaxID=2320716 RepID=A0AAP0GAP8_9ASPA
MNTIEGLATRSTAMVNLFRCSIVNPFTPGNPTNAFFSGVNSVSSMISSMNTCKHSFIVKLTSLQQIKKIVDDNLCFGNPLFLSWNQHQQVDEAMPSK